MTDKVQTPSELASSVAEAVRSLNHATFKAGVPGWEYPSDAYSVLGGLERAVSSLPQAIGQVSSLLSRLDADGHVGSTDVPPAVTLAGPTSL